MKYVYIRDSFCYAEEESEDLAFYVGRLHAIGGAVYPWKDGDPHPLQVLLSQTASQEQPVVEGAQTL